MPRRLEMDSNLMIVYVAGVGQTAGAGLTAGAGQPARAGPTARVGQSAGLEHPHQPFPKLARVDAA